VLACYLTALFDQSVYRVLHIRIVVHTGGKFS